MGRRRCAAQLLPSDTDMTYPYAGVAPRPSAGVVPGLVREVIDTPCHGGQRLGESRR